MAGDFHQHTYYTDGEHTLDEVIENGFKYGLDFQANSEHGGSRYRDGYNHFWDDPTYYPVNPIKGDVKINNNGHQEMWRWTIFERICISSYKFIRETIIKINLY